MESTIPNPILSCPSCGAVVNETLSSNIKCEYCGSDLNINTEDGSDISVGKSRSNSLFKRDKAEFKDKMTRWIASQDGTPTDLLLTASFSSIKKVCSAIYEFKGTYNGSFNIENKRGKLLSDNNPLSGEFCIRVYAGHNLGGNANHDAVAYYLSRNDQKKLYTLSEIDGSDANVDKVQGKSVIWDTYGVSTVAKQVYKKLQSESPSEENVYNHYLKYDVKSVRELYLPLWSVTYQYDKYYSVYMDDESGEIVGNAPEFPLLERPDKKAAFNRYLLYGFCIWFSLYFIKSALLYVLGKDFEQTLSYYDNILISPPVEEYWLLRGVLLLVVYPFVMVNVFFDRITDKHVEKIRKLRKDNLDLILTGRKQVKFNEHLI